MEINSRKDETGSNGKFTPSIGWKGIIRYIHSENCNITTEVTIRGVCNGYVQVTEFGLRKIYPLDSVVFY